MGAPLFLFDFDQTLSAFDFRERLPALARLTGMSQYHLASTWWGGGHERAAEAGEYATTESYLEAFGAVTGTELTREQWVQARLAAMTPVPVALDALRLADGLGTASLLSNNPIIFHDCFTELAPEAASILSGEGLVSAQLGARKPGALVFSRALDRFGVDAADAMLIDDAAVNVAGARDAGLAAFQFTLDGPDANGALLADAIRAFAAERARPRVVE